MRSLATLLVGLFYAESVLAVRVDFRAIRNNERVAGAEVCFFRGDATHQLKSYFSSGEVHCLSADKVIDMPVGNWHFFARADGLVTHWPGFIQIERPLPEAFKAIRMELVPAGLLKLEALRRRLRAGQHLIAYFPGSGPDYLPFLFPLPEAQATLLVPASRTFYPIIAESGRPVWIGRPHRVEPKKSVELSVDSLSDRTLVAWMQFDRTALRRWGLPNTVPTPPVVTARGKDGRSLAAAFPVQHFGEPDLIIIPGLSDDELELVSAGPRWKTHHREIVISKNSPSVTVIDDPIPAKLLGNVMIDWTLDQRWVTPSPLCAGSGDSVVTPLQFMIVRCANDPSILPSARFPKDCEFVKEISVQPTSKGSTEFHDVEEGTYWLRFTAPQSTPWYQQFTIAASERFRIKVEPTYRTISGRVTMNQAPLGAQVTFLGGLGTSNPVTGFYEVMLSRDPGAGVIRIRPCASTITYMDHPDRELRAGDVYDIDLTMDPLLVRAVDARSSLPVAQAECELRFEMPKLDQTTLPLQGTDQDGAVTIPMSRRSFDALRRSRPAVCCEHPEYLESCVDIPGGVTTAFVALDPKKFRKGKVQAAGDIRGGRVYWVSPLVGVTEQARVEQDGWFVYQRDHGADEYLVFVAVSHPLHVLAQSTTGGTLLVPLLAGPLREARVHPRPTMSEAVSIGLAIGGKTVPSTALTYHQMIRGLQVESQPNQTLLIRDLIASEPIEILVGYTASQYPPTARAATPDFFLLPEHRRSFQAIPLGPNPDITLP